MAARELTEIEVDLAERIRTAIESSGKSQEQIAAEVGVSQGMVWQWANARRAVPAKRAIALAHALGIEDPGEISIQWVLAALGVPGARFGTGVFPYRDGKRVQVVTGVHAEELDKTAGHIEVPVWDASAAAGSGAINEATGGPKGSILFRSRSLSKKGISAGSSHVCYVQGDSMTPRLRDGDAVLFDTSETTIRPGKVYVIRRGDETFIKRLFPEGARIRVSSDNKADPQWADWFVDVYDPDFTVVGRVRWVGSWED